MPAEETWAEYSKLVLNELERLNDSYERMRQDMGHHFNEMNVVLNEFKNTEKAVNEHKQWIEKVNDVWSPNQMKMAKDEIYEQKGKWTAAIAIFTFIQIIMGLLTALGFKFIK